MNVFVTGASGFVGEEILRALHQAGHRVRILVRGANSLRNQNAASRFNAQIHIGNVLDTATLPGGLGGIDAVIHLVGIISEVGRNTYENVHIRGTENIVTATRDAGIKRYIHMSALGTRPNAVARYHKSKWAAEEIVRPSGLHSTIFRPSIIYGPRDQFVNLFARIARFSPIVPVMGSGHAKMQPVPVSDVAKCFVGALTESKSIGQIYDLCGCDVLSFEQILDAILEITGRKRWKLHIPMSVARAQAALLEFIFPHLLRKASPLNRDQLLMLEEDNVGNAQLANELFHLHPTAFKEGIAYLKKT